MTFFRSTSYLSLFFLALVLLSKPVLSSEAVSKSSNFKLYNGQVNPIVGQSSGGNKDLQLGGASISGIFSSNSYDSQQGTIFGWKNQQSSDSQTTQQSSGGGSFLSSQDLSDYEPEIKDLSVVQINTSSAKVSFSLESPARASIYYSSKNEETRSTDLNNSLLSQHKIGLNNLIPNTGYNFRIKLENSQDQTYFSQTNSFTTLPEYKTPPSVLNFKAIAIADIVQFTWDNPKLKDFKQVKIVRSSSSYPSDSSDGKLIFSGDREYHFDTTVERGEMYYYSAFVEDTSGNISSGAIASVSVTLEDKSEKPADEEKPKREEQEDKKDALQPQPTKEKIDTGRELKPVKPEIIKDIKDEIGKEIDQITKERLLEELKQRVEGYIKKKEKKKKEEKEEFEIPIQEPSEKEYEITIPAEPPEIPEIAVPVNPEEKSGAQDEMSMFTLLEQKISGTIERLNEAVSQAASSSREKLKQIKEGLITDSNRIRPEVYRSLDKKEKNKVKSLIDLKTITTTEKTAAKVIPHSVKAEKAGADWHVYSGSKALFVIPKSTFKKPVKSITLTINKEGYVLSYNEETGNYEAVIEAPPEKGKYEMIVQVFYKDNTYEQLKKTVLVDPYGYVYKEVFRDWSWSKPWQIFTTKKVGVKKAKVTLYTKNETDEWVQWPGHLYNQYNPQFTGKDGAFSFVAPPGEYYLRAEAEGFLPTKTDTFTVDDKIVNRNIKLRRYTRIQIWSAAVGSGIMLVLIIIATQKYIRRETESRKLEQNE
ncbi:MAG: hypothetical protein ABEJ02_04630 [Candidatus Paceibacteria bacterium]